MILARLAGASLALVALAGCGGKGAGVAQPSAALPVALKDAPSPARHWHRIATATDRGRLREWRTAWLTALAEARADGAGGKIAADAPLFAFDLALTDPVPPEGDYRCRTIKLGSKGTGGLRYVAYSFFRCRVAARGDGSSLDKLTGSQRASGSIYPHEATRAVFLGTMALGDERSAVSYGRDATRDVAGWVERIGPARWRVAFPYPAFESTLDVLELVPA